MARFLLVGVIRKVHYPSYATNLVASVRAGKISLVENATNALEVTLDSQGVDELDAVFLDSWFILSVSLTCEDPSVYLRNTFFL